MILPLRGERDLSRRRPAGHISGPIADARVLLPCGALVLVGATDWLLHVIVMEEAAPAISLTVRDVTGEVTVHEGVHPAETDVETFRAAVAAARGTEPALLRLVRGDVPLDDGLRTLAKYGILELSLIHI